MSSKQTEQYRAMSNERRDAISAFVDAHFASGNASYEQPICTPIEFQKSLRGDLVGFMDAKPYLGFELMDLNDGGRWYARKHFQHRWQKLPAATKDQAMAMEYKRTLAIPLVDRLQDENTPLLKEILIDQMLRAGEIEKEDAPGLHRRVSYRGSNPASATILASEYLLRWRSGQADNKTVDIARALLEDAANQGDPQACFMLANEYLVDDHLCKDADVRNRYHMWAVRCGHKPSIENEEEKRSHAKDWEDEAHDGWLDSLDEDLKRLNETISQTTPKADAGDPEAQFMLGDALVEKQELLAKAGGTVEVDQSVIDQSISLINQAVPNVPQAYWWLGKREPDTQRAIELLRSAISPQEPQKPYFPALLPLAEKLAEVGDVRGAEEALRLAIKKKREGEKRILGAELQLARLLDEHCEATDASLNEARELYLAHAPAVLHPWSTLRAAVMCLRGEGGPQDIERARSLFEKASRQGWGGLKLRYFAELGYTLGWGKLDACTRAPELLTRLLALNDFQVVDTPPFGVEDIELLLSLNGEFQEFTQYTAVDESEWEKTHEIDLRHLNGIGHPLRVNYRSLILALSNLLLSRGSEENYHHSIRSDYFLDRYSMLANYVIAGLAGAGRMPSVLASHVDRWLDRVAKLAEVISRTIGLGPTHMRAYEFYVWLRERAQSAHIGLKEKEIENERRRMISFLSHTLTSSTSGTADLLRQITAEIVKATGKDDLSSIARRLAPEIASTAMVESLVEVFKLYTSDPSALRDQWEQDLGGSVPLAQTCAMAIRQALLRFYFSTEFEASFGHMMPNADYEGVVGAFMEDILPLDMSQSSQLESFFQWIDVHLPFLRLTLEDIDSLRLKKGGPRDIVIFAVVGEFLGNALKYAADGGLISLRIRWINDGLELSCSNPVDTASPVPALGGKSGLSAIREVCRLVRAKFPEPAVVDNVFSLRVTLPIK